MNSTRIEARSERCIAAAGDVHGAVHALVRGLEAAEERAGRAAELVLQVGDFEPHRSGGARFEQPLWFIGGNHEPHRFLEQMPDGGEAAPGCRYLGRAGAVEWRGLRIAYLSGIFDPRRYDGERPEPDAPGGAPPQELLCFRRGDVARLDDLDSADVLLLHDWPSGLERFADPDLLAGRLERMGLERAGNPVARELVERLAPRLVLCGHMHMPCRAELPTRRGREAQVICLDKTERADPVLLVLGDHGEPIETESRIEPG
ncbi:MAG: metallophosphoesterase [Polyangia bacterium]